MPELGGIWNQLGCQLLQKGSNWELGALTVKWCLAWRPWQAGPYSSHSISGAEPVQTTDGAKREQLGQESVPNWEEGDNPSASPIPDRSVATSRLDGFCWAPCGAPEHKGGFALS